ncbi:MAG: glycosyltransferase [Candidatus Dependentiae bacterium]
MKKVFVLLLCCFFSAQGYEKLLPTFCVDFQKSMNTHPDHDVQFSLNNKRWQIAQKLYEKNVLNDLTYSDQARIPLVVHHIWVGSPLPEYAQMFRKTWIDHNPNWTFVLWTDHPSTQYGGIVLDSFQQLKLYLKQPEKEQFIVMDMRKVSLKNQYAYEKRAKNYGEKSDIARYEILYNIGGLYVDTDFECLRSFDELHHCCDFYTGVNHDKPFYLYNGLIASVSGCPILKEAIDGLTNRRQRADSLAYSGPYYFADCFIKRVSEVQGPVIPFPVTFLYPWPHHYRRQTGQRIKEWIRPESYAIHHWKVSWQK